MKIYTYSIVNSGFDAYADKTPYVVAIVEDEGGQRQAAFIQNYTEGMHMEIGMTVQEVERSKDGNLICELV